MCGKIYKLGVIFSTKYKFSMCCDAWQFRAMCTLTTCESRIDHDVQIVHENV